MASYSVVNSLRSDGDNVSKVHRARTQCSQKLKWPPIIFSLPCARRAIKIASSFPLTRTCCAASARCKVRPIMRTSRYQNRPLIGFPLSMWSARCRDAKCGLLCARRAIRTGHYQFSPFHVIGSTPRRKVRPLGQICRLNRVWPVELDRSSHALDRSRGRDGENSIRPDNLTPPSDSRRESRLKSG